MVDEVTAPDLAQRLGDDDKKVRAWLRRQWRAGHGVLRGHDLHRRWRFDEAEAAQLEREYRAERGY